MRSRRHRPRRVRADADGVRRAAPRRDARVREAQRGAPLIVAGSEQFPGAAILCALGRRRAAPATSRSRRRRRAAPRCARISSSRSSSTYDDSDPQRAVADDPRPDAITAARSAIGPGSASTTRSATIVRGVIDGDARCRSSSTRARCSTSASVSTRCAANRCVLTPHAGEFARLSGKGTIAPASGSRACASSSTSTGSRRCSKAARRSSPTAARVHINPTGTPALATAGTGDVLTGIIATLLSQGLSPVDAGARRRLLARPRGSLRRRSSARSASSPATSPTPRPRQRPSSRTAIRSAFSSLSSRACRGIATIAACSTSSA